MMEAGSMWEAMRNVEKRCDLCSPCHLTDVYFQAGRRGWIGVYADGTDERGSPIEY